MDNDQGSVRSQLNLTLTEPPIVTNLTGGDVVATFKGRDAEGEDRFARFNLPSDTSVNSLYDFVDKAEKAGSVDLDGFWKTRRYNDADSVERTRLEFVITDIEPKREAERQVESAKAAPEPAQASAPEKVEAGKSDARQASIALLASKDDLDKAILQMETAKAAPGATPVAAALATYAEAIAQPQYEAAGDGKFKRTGEVLSGMPALTALRQDFGEFAHRNIYIDAARASAIEAKLEGDLSPQAKATLKDAQGMTSERRAEARAAKAPEPTLATAPPAPAKAPVKAKSATEAKAAPAKAPVLTAAKTASAAPSSIAHQKDPLILTASIGEIKAATTSKAGLNSAVASTLRTFGAAVSQPEWKAKAGGGFEKTGKLFKGMAGLKMLVDGFGKGAYRNIMLDKAVVTDIMMAMPDTTKSNDAMAAALESSQKRRDEMAASKTTKPKVKQRDRDRD